MELLRYKGRFCPTAHFLHVLYGNDPDGGPLGARKVFAVTMCSLRKLVPWKIVNRYSAGYRIEGYEGSVPPPRKRRDDDF